MGDLSSNFSRVEFSCKCGCGFDTVDYQLLDILEQIRWNFGVPVRITSGCRCKAHNEAVGGSKDSQHLLGRAADFTVDGVPTRFVRAFANRLNVPGMGSYKGFVHIDTRSGKRARW